MKTVESAVMTQECSEYLDRAERTKIVSHEVIPLSDVRCFPMDPHSSSWEACLDESGRELLLTVQCEEWLFIWVVDVEASVVRSRVSLPVPDGSTWHYKVTIDGDTLWYVTTTDVLEVSRADWTIRRRRCLGDLLPDDILVEDARIFPRSDHLWISTSYPLALFVVDLETWTLTRHLAETSPWMMPVVGAPEPLVFFAEGAVESQLYRTDGTPVRASAEVPTDYQTMCLACAPRPGAFVALEMVERPDADGTLADLIFRLLVPAGDASEGAETFRAAARFSRIVVEPGSHRGAFSMAMSADRRTCFVLIHPWRGEDRVHLLAVAVSEKSFRLRYRVPVAFDTSLVQDPRGRRVVAVFTDRQGLRVVPLDAGRPSPGCFSEVELDRPPLFAPSIEFDEYDCCDEVLNEHGKPPSQDLSDDMEPMTPAQRKAFLGHYRAGFEDDVDELINLFHALDRIKLGTTDSARETIEEEREQVLRSLIERFPEHPVVALMAADRAAVRGRWPEVRRWLRAAEPGCDGGNRGIHLELLRGLAQLHAGRPERAWTTFEKISGSSSFYRLRNLIELTRPMADPPEPDEWGPDRSMVRQFLGVIRTADRALEAADAGAALAALDRPAFWQTGEVQTVARLAAVSLEEPAATAAERFQKRFVLAFFGKVLARDALHKRHVRLPGVSWDPGRLVQLHDRARDWLEEDR